MKLEQKINNNIKYAESVREYQIKKEQYKILSKLIKSNKIKYNSLELRTQITDSFSIGMFNIKGIENKIYLMSINNKDRLKLIKKLKKLNIKIN